MFSLLPLPLCNRVSYYLSPYLISLSHLMLITTYICVSYASMRVYFARISSISRDHCVHNCSKTMYDMKIVYLRSVSSPHGHSASECNLLYCTSYLIFRARESERARTRQRERGRNTFISNGTQINWMDEKDEIK